MAKPDFQFDLENALDQPPKATLRDPFGSKDTSAYFASEESNQQLSLLEHLSRYSSMLSVVQGPQGSGKSRFMMEFSRHQDETSIISHVKGTMLMTAGQLLQAIYLGFADQFKQAPNETTFGPLLKLSHDLAEQGKIAVILIDNAQELNTDAISMLLDMMSLATENQTVPHVILFTESSLSRNLDSYQRSRYDQLSHTLTLAPYSLEQTRAYMLHRVRAVGGGISLPFNEKQIKQIYEESGGYPGRINQAAQILMGKGGKLGKRKFNLAMGFPLAHMAMLSVVMLALLVAVLFNDSDSAKSVADSNNVIPLTLRQGQSSSDTIARMDAMQRQIGQKKIELPPIPDDISVPPISTSQKNTDKPAVVESALPTAPIRLEAPIKKAAPPLEVKPAPTKVIEDKVVASNEQDVFNKTQWWLKQNPNRYTLQLLGTHNKSTVQNFIRDQGSIDTFSYFKSEYNGKDWYVVVYGMYRNRSEAIAGSEGLPKDLRSLNPWARSVRGIQGDIKKSQ